MKKLYAGKLINFGFPVGIAFEYYQEINALGGGSEIFATWDNPNLNPNGNPQALSKSLNAIAIVELPSQTEFDTFEALPNIYNLQTVLLRENPSYTEIIQTGDQSAKEAAILQLRAITNAAFTPPEVNQLKQEFPLIETSTATIHDTFIPILNQDAYVTSFTVPETFDKELLQVAAITGPMTITLPATITTLKINRIDEQPNTCSFDGGANTTNVTQIFQNSTITIQLTDGVWDFA